MHRLLGVRMYIIDLLCFHYNLRVFVTVTLVLPLVMFSHL